MSNVIDIPKAKDSQNLNPSDYETILQISDVNPIGKNNTFNKNAIKFYDNDLSVIETTSTTNYVYKQRNIIHHFKDDNGYVEDLVAKEDNTTDIETGAIPEGYSTSPVINNESVYSVTKERTMLRKRVLTMPDVAVPTYGPGRLIIDYKVETNSAGGDDVGHTERVPNSTRTSRENNHHYIPDNTYYQTLTDASWDGFTIRHGLMYDEVMCHVGGAGVNMYE